MGHQCDEGITSVGHSAWSFFMSGHSWPKVAEYTNMVDRAATTSSWTALHSMCTPTTATEVSTEASRAWLHEVDARFRGAPCRWARSNGRSPSCCSSWRHKSFQRCKRHFQQVKRRRYRAVAAALPLAAAVHLVEEMVFSGWKWLSQDWGWRTCCGSPRRRSPAFGVSADCDTWRCRARRRWSLLQLSFKETARKAPFASGTKYRLHGETYGSIKSPTRTDQI